MAILHTEFSSSDFDESKISAFDKKTYSYIDQYGDISYDPIITDETDWQVFYNLTELRKGILSWYDFSSEARVLEVGAAFGTLTGCLCRKCAHVTATDRSFYRARAIAARYENVDNLDIYAGEVTDILFPELFDCIVLIGLLERAGGGSGEVKPYADYLTVLKKWLKPGGRLLFAVENRFGLRYFCGEAEPHTRRAFDGLNRYPRGTRGYSFSHKEIEKVVKAAGFGYHRFYYPMPDYKLPQLIYTDDWLPGKNLQERLIPYYRRCDTLVASERELYDDVIENGVFPFFANSFLVECGMEEFGSGVGVKQGTAEQNTTEQDTAEKNTAEQNPIHEDKADDMNNPRKTAASGQTVYAAVSTDRGEDWAFATVIRSDGVVRKTPLYEKGRYSARKAYENIVYLQAHGIPVVEHRLLTGDILELPFISWPTLSDYIKEIMGKDREEFLHLIDRIYEYILLSSEQVPEELNRLPEALGFSRPGSGAERTEGSRPEEAKDIRLEGTGDIKPEEIEGVSQSSGKHAEPQTQPRHFGPILKKAYMELIPLNCFYNAQTKEFLYFDQEFVRENYPAKYVLFRAIHYIYCFTPNAEQYYPKQKLWQKYEMEDTWKIYLKEEERFLNEVRNREQYKQFYRWTQIDRGQMLKNAENLGS